jgi:hypothetical protein
MKFIRFVRRFWLYIVLYEYKNTYGDIIRRQIEGEEDLELAKRFFSRRIFIIQIKIQSLENGH